MKINLMQTLYEKQCVNQYLEKYDKNDNLLRTAEQFDSGNWVVCTYKGIDLSGEYSEKEFSKIKNKFRQ